MNKILFTKILLCAFFMCNFFIIQAQVWTGNVDSNWNNPANWSGNQVPTTGNVVTVPGTASGGNFPIFEGNPVIDYTIQNAGVITFNSFVFNTGTIINFNVGQLISNNFFVNAGKVVFDNDGHFDNNGIFENYGEFDNAASAIFNNNTNAAFNNYGVFRNFGNLNNMGAFINAGNFSSTQTFNNQGSLTNFGYFDNVFGSTYNNAAGASTQNNNGGTLASNGTFNNVSTLQNNGEVILNFGATFTNTGNVNNNNKFQNAGKIYNNSTFVNNALLRNNDAALIENNATLQNAGTIDNGTCARIIQRANNTIAGPVENNGGLIYVLAGAVNVTSGEFGFEFTNLNQTAPPVPGCKPNVQVSLNQTGVAVVQVTDIDKGSYGICGAQITSRTVSPNTFGVANIGQVVVTLSITDEFNLTSTCDAIVQILPYVAPLTAVDDPDIALTCPNNITLTTLPGANTAAASWTVPTGTSNCAPTTSNCANTPSSFPNTIYMGERNGSKYFCSQYNLTYAQGRQLATQMGGYLAVVNDAAENEYIRSHIMASSAWIGYTDEANEGTFVWENNQSSSYTNWDAGQPNNYGGNEDYTRILQSNGKWTDLGSSTTLEAVIEIPCGSTQISCNNVSENLPELLFMGEYNGSKYFCSQYNLTYAQAKQKAIQVGGQLAVVNNATENEYIRSRIMASSAWIGYTDEVNEGTFVWENNQSSSYTNWDAGQPNNYGGNEDYTRILQSNGKWTDLGSSTTLEAVIEIPCGSGNTGGGTGALVIEQIKGLTNGSSFFVGTNQIAYKATDDCGNEEICIFNVIVEKTPSVITATCPSDIVINALPGAESAVATWTTPTGTSNCFSSTGVRVSRIGEGLQSGAAFPVGTTFIAYALQDSCGTVATCNFSVTVNAVPAALTLLSCPQDLTGSNPISWVAPTASTTCYNGNINVRQIEGPANGSGTFPQGVSRVSYLISDDCGNVEVCTFFVTNDGSAPITEVSITCPANRTITVPAGSGGTTVTLEQVTGSTTCANGVVNITQTSGPANSTFLPRGVTNFTYQATDNCGNTATCSYQITIVELQGTGDLTIYCPGDQIGRAPVGGSSAVVNWTAPTASTTCTTSPNVVVTQIDGLPNGSAFPVGTSMVTFQATDECGNVATCTFKIMVTNEECNINALVSNILCDDNGTPNNPNDDTFTFDVLVSGVGNPWGWTGGGQTVAYDVVTEFGPYNISGGTVSFNLTDTDNPTCTTSISVNPPAPCSTTPNVCNNSILFVVGSLTLNSGDAAAKARMESLNFNITMVDDNVVQSSDANGKGLVVISSTVNSTYVGSKFRNTTVPVLTWEAWIYDDMKMTSTGENVNYGEFSSDKRVVINQASHPIAAGLTGTNDVLTANKALNWGKPTSAANIIACLPGDETKVLVFAYETGKSMAGLSAPARRVGFFLRNTTAQCMNSKGWKMFDAAIIWAAGCTPTTQQLARPSTEIYDAVTEKVSTETSLAVESTTLESGVSISSSSASADFSVFPNPASNDTNLDLNGFMGKKVEVLVYNQMGQLVKTQSLGELNQAFVKLDLTTMQNGIYNIRVVADGRTVTKNLLVTR